MIADTSPVTLASPLTPSPPGPPLPPPCPDFDAYLERALELAQRTPAAGPAPFVLLLRVISHLRLGADPRLAATFSNYYQVGGHSLLNIGTESGLGWEQGKTGRRRRAEPDGRGQAMLCPHRRRQACAAEL